MNPNPAFKRFGDPGGCTKKQEASPAADCLGVRMHCRLREGHLGTCPMEVSTPYHLKHLEG